jgi:hypothetical protein
MLGLKPPQTAACRWLVQDTLEIVNNEQDWLAGTRLSAGALQKPPQERFE